MSERKWKKQNNEKLNFRTSKKKYGLTALENSRLIYDRQFSDKPNQNWENQIDK